VVLKDSEEPVEADVDRGGLDHRRVERLDPHTFCGDLFFDIAIAQ
jgi:hypothetical protein